MEVMMLILAIGLVLSGPVALIVALVLRSDMKRVRAELRALGGRTATSLGAVETPPSAPAPAAPVAAETSAPAAPRRRVEPRPRTPRERRDLEALIGGQWLTWVGIMAVFFGTAFFLAADLGTGALAGTGQVLLGTLVAFVFVVTGTLLSSRAQRFLGRGLLGGGIALLFLAAYAAHGFHALVPATVVYPFLLAVAAIGTVSSLRHDAISVAILTTTGALATPAFLSAPGNPAPFLFPYLIICTVGALAVATRRRWVPLPLVTFAGVALQILHWWDRSFSADAVGAALAGVTPLWLAFAALPFVARHGAADSPRTPWSGVESLIVAGNGLGYAAVLYAALTPNAAPLRGIAIALLALIYVVLGRAGWTPATRSPASRLTHYTGIVLAVVAVPCHFDAESTTLAWTLLGTALVVSGLRLGSGPHRAMGLGVFVLSVFRVLVFDTRDLTSSASLEHPVLNVSFLVGTLTAAAIGFAARQLHRHRDALSPTERSLLTTLALVAPSVFLWRVSIETIATFGAREAVVSAPGSLRLPMLMTLSLIWAVYAGALILVGFLTSYRPLRLLGVAVLGVLVLKVFAFDIDVLREGYRIATFVGVGLLLLAISLLYQRERST